MAIDNIDPNELSLQDAAGMQLVHVIRRIIEEINNGGDTPTPTPSEPTGIFWCEYNVTTASEIIAAVNNNQLPVIYYDDLVFVLNKVSNNVCCFSSVYFGSMRPAFNYIEVTGSRWAEATDRLQAKLTFDYAPTQGSLNPVTSGGVYTAISNIQIDPQDIADAVDDWLNDHSSSIGGLTFEAKQALLNCFAHVAWIDANGQTYYNALYNALFNTATLESIYALFTQGSAVIYDTDSLDSLRQYLVVTAYYSDETSAVVTDYTLSGTLTVGTSTITASYGDKSSTFNVTVSQRTTLASISAVFNQGSAVVYTTDTLDSLKQYLTVTANYSDSSTATVPSADYTLSGTLTAGTSTITVSYGGKTDTFTVTVTQATTLVSITAVFNQGSAVIYDTDSLDTLKQYLVVTANYSNSTTATVPSTDYTLSGTLSVGISTITVSYSGKTDTFTVTVTSYIQYSYSYANGDLEKVNGASIWRDAYHLAISTSGNNANTRRVFPLDYGVRSYHYTTDEINFTDTSSYYPIPVPSDATQVTVSITPASQYHAETFYVLENGEYTRTGNPGWKQGSFTHTFSAGTYEYMSINCKYDSAGSSYSIEPTDMTILFE